MSHLFSLLGPTINLSLLKKQNKKPTNVVGGGGEVGEMKIMVPQHISQKLTEYKTNITLSSKDLTQI